LRGGAYARVLVGKGGALGDGFAGQGVGGDGAGTFGLCDVALRVRCDLRVSVLVG